MVNRSLTTRGSSHGTLASLLQSRAWVAGLSILATLFVSQLVLPVIVPSRHTTQILSADLSRTVASPRGAQAAQKLLILTPLKDAAPWLDEYFVNLAKLHYPPHLITLAFLVSDTTDPTLALLHAKARQLARGPAAKRYDAIHIFQKDFHFNLAAQVRHGFEGQPVRRAFIARARNFLLTAALRHDHAWVLWLDVDVVRYDADIVTDLMSVDKDVVVPNTLWYQQDTWDFWGFDRNNFAESEESLALLKQIGPDILLVEGYNELKTHRNHLVDMPTHLGLAHVPLDGVGCTFTLVKAHVHREGVMFPTYTFDNQIETEGFAKVAKKAGFEVVGVPGSLVFHAVNS